MAERLTPDDVPVLTLVLTQLIEAYAPADEAASNRRIFDESARELKEEEGKAEEASIGSLDAVLQRMNRVRIDGRQLVGAELVQHEGEAGWRISYLSDISEIKGGAVAVCNAIAYRTRQLQGMPMGEDELTGDRTPEEVADILRLAAGIEIADEEPAVHQGPEA